MELDFSWLGKTTGNTVTEAFNVRFRAQRPHYNRERPHGTWAQVARPISGQTVIANSRPSLQSTGFGSGPFGESCPRAYQLEMSLGTVWGEVRPSMRLFNDHGERRR